MYVLCRYVCTIIKNGFSSTSWKCDERERERERERVSERDRQTDRQRDRDTKVRQRDREREIERLANLFLGWESSNFNFKQIQM